MKLSIILGILLSFSAMAEDAVLTKSKIDLGNISDAEANTAVNRSFQFIRNAKSPESVTVKYKINFLKKDCINHEVKKTEIPEFKKIVCSGDNTGYSCEEKIFSGLYEASVVCTEQGLVRDTEEREVTLNFKKAVALSPSATEKIALNLKQAGMKSNEVESTGSVLESSSLYEVKKSLLGLGNQINFKAK
ncbi:MAG: hypothetical protein WC635_09090 [Bacteriovorax sp.]|jgi:hypothetical protein